MLWQSKYEASESLGQNIIWLCLLINWICCKQPFFQLLVQDFVNSHCQTRRVTTLGFLVSWKTLWSQWHQTGTLVSLTADFLILECEAVRNNRFLCVPAGLRKLSLPTQERANIGVLLVSCQSIESNGVKRTLSWALQKIFFNFCLKSEIKARSRPFLLVLRLQWL